MKLVSGQNKAQIATWCLGVLVNRTRDYVSNSGTGITFCILSPLSIKRDLFLPLDRFIFKLSQYSIAYLCMLFNTFYFTAIIQYFSYSIPDFHWCYKHATYSIYLYTRIVPVIRKLVLFNVKFLDLISKLIIINYLSIILFFSTRCVCLSIRTYI